MITYYWPIALIVLSNIFYHICAKSSPSSVNPFATLTITYLIGAIVSAVLYFALNRGGNLVRELSHLNWAPFVLGIAIVGLEVGNIYAYKVGWQISTEAIVQSSFLAVALLFLGALAYHESLNLSKLMGVLICMIGLYFINK